MSYFPSQQYSQQQGFNRSSNQRYDRQNQNYLNDRRGGRSDYDRDYKKYPQRNDNECYNNNQGNQYDSGRGGLDQNHYEGGRGRFDSQHDTYAPAVYPKSNASGGSFGIVNAHTVNGGGELDEDSCYGCGGETTRDDVRLAYNARGGFVEHYGDANDLRHAENSNDEFSFKDIASLDSIKPFVPKVEVKEPFSMFQNNSPVEYSDFHETESVNDDKRSISDSYQNSAPLYSNTNQGNAHQTNNNQVNASQANFNQVNPNQAKKFEIVHSYDNHSLNSNITHIDDQPRHNQGYKGHDYDGLRTSTQKYHNNRSSSRNQCNGEECQDKSFLEQAQAEMYGNRHERNFSDSSIHRNYNDQSNSNAFHPPNEFNSAPAPYNASPGASQFISPATSQFVSPVASHCVPPVQMTSSTQLSQNNSQKFSSHQTNGQTVPTATNDARYSEPVTFIPRQEPQYIESNVAHDLLPPTHPAFTQESKFSENSKSMEKEVHGTVIEGEIEVYGNLESCGFNPILQKRIRDSSYPKPALMQSNIMPVLCAQKDFKVEIVDKTTKNCSFLLPIIDKILEGGFVHESNQPIAVILTPTRESLLEICDIALEFTKGTSVSIAKGFGQYMYKENVEELKRGCNILCITPGRLNHFLKSQEISLTNLKYLIIDDAGDMYLRNFFDIIRKIINEYDCCPSEYRVNGIFAEQFNPEVNALALEILKENFVTITSKTKEERVNVSDIIKVENGFKNKTILEIIRNEMNVIMKKQGPNAKLPRILIFVSLKQQTDIMADFLIYNGLHAFALNNDKPGDLKANALHEFNLSKLPILVVTEESYKTATGVEFDVLINSDLPSNAAAYVEKAKSVSTRLNARMISLFDPEQDFSLAKSALMMLAKL